MNWGTPKVEEAVEASEWPQGYRERNAVQELSFQGMVDQWNYINYRRKVIRGPDRQQQRKQAHLAQSMETAHKRVDKMAEAVTAQKDKMAESEAKGHGKRLKQRQRPFVTLEAEIKDAQAKHATLSEQAATLGPAGQPAVRDFRKQTSITIRALLLENMFRAFMVALLAALPTQVSLERILRLLFERRGGGWRRLRRSSTESIPLGYPYRIDACWTRSSRDFTSQTYRIMSNQFAFVSKPCRLEATLTMDRSNVYFFKTVRGCPKTKA